MNIASATIWFIILVILIIVVGGILLQIYLSKQKNRWLGLLLPAVTLFRSLYSVIDLLAFKDMIEANIVMLIGGHLLISNITTAILLLVYFICRKKLNTQLQLKKMNVQDLD